MAPFAQKMPAFGAASPFATGVAASDPLGVNMPTDGATSLGLTGAQPAAPTRAYVYM